MKTVQNLCGGGVDPSETVIDSTGQSVDETLMVLQQLM